MVDRPVGHASSLGELRLLVDLVGFLFVYEANGR